jgi:serine/threonine protein kinase/formylglycine-generating enzyme required for sulfatase activity
MDGDRMERVAELFEGARELAGAERDDWLRTRCGDDDELLTEVTNLLAEYDRQSPMLEPGRHAGLVRGWVETQASPIEPDQLPPFEIPGFRLLAVLGEGAQGAVYEAEQESPRRTVALKLLRPHLGASNVRHRFEREAQTLARLSHPGIAVVHGSGVVATEFGSLPYFAMELVRGEPLTDYAVRRELDADARIALLVEVCEAVAHAHAKGVVHRDLKPSNILVDEAGRPRVLDFGVARLLSRDVDTATFETGTGQVIGTLAYMSPEQAAGDPEAVDQRADVFALGVLAFELLTGALPRDLAGRPLAEQVRILADGETSLLSSVDRALDGDLETIVAKALASEPVRRYSEAGAMAADLRRYLAREPIAARPATTLYRVSRFVRRHRGMTASLALTFAVLVLGAVSSLMLYLDASARADEVLQLSARETYRELVAEAETLWPIHPHKIEAYCDWIDRARRLTERLPRHRATLAELAASTSPSPSVEAPVADVDERWWASLLGELIHELEALEDEETGLLAERGLSSEYGWSVPRRLEYAREMAQAFAPGGAHAERWERDLPAIRAAYPGAEVEVQIGLVPIGVDPVSGLHEFWHPLSGTEPIRDSDGVLRLSEQSGLVLVLVPGGAFLMGSQGSDPAGPNYDPASNRTEWPLHDVELSPFFLSKFELNQAQWKRLVGHNPSFNGPEGSAPQPVGLVAPVERVDRNQAEEWCVRAGLALPSEAQWEFAARAGTDSIWWTGDDLADLFLVENVCQWQAMDAGIPIPGTSSTYPVDEFEPNPMGFHHMHGNVSEWVYDGFKNDPNMGDELYYREPRLDPVGPSEDVDGFFFRGGSFYKEPEFSRSACRGAGPVAATFFDRDLGLRPGRPLRD